MQNIIVKVVIVVLKASRLSAAKLVEYVESILLKMIGNLSFPTPTPDLKTVALANEDFKTALSNAAQGSKAAKALVAVKRRELMLLLEQLRGYVQSTANNDAPTAEQVAISSGMFVKKMRPIPLRTFKVMNTITSGTVKLTCPKNKGDITFDYQYTTTPDDIKSYVSIGALPKVTRLIIKLTVGVKYSFRYSAINKDGQTDWSNVIVITVT